MARFTEEETRRIAELVEEIEAEDGYDMPWPVDAEDAEDLFGLVMGEMAATESDWHTAAPAVPFVHLAPQQVETPLPQWDGPLRPKPRTPFDEVFDAEMLEEYRNRLPQFKPLTGRFEPFDADKLRDLFDNQNYSTFLKRPVLTFKDALAHSIQLALFWLDEDEAAASAPQSEFAELVKEAVDVAAPEGADYEERVAAAKKVWKDAVQERKEILDKLDAKVLAARTRWQEEKLKR